MIMRIPHRTAEPFQPLAECPELDIPERIVRAFAEKIRKELNKERRISISAFYEVRPLGDKDFVAIPIIQPYRPAAERASIVDTVLLLDPEQFVLQRRSDLPLIWPWGEPALLEI